MESGIQDETSIFECKAVFSAGEIVRSRLSLVQYPAGRMQILWLVLMVQRDRCRSVV